MSNFEKLIRKHIRPNFMLGSRLKLNGAERKLPEAEQNAALLEKAQNLGRDYSKEIAEALKEYGIPTAYEMVTLLNPDKKSRKPSYQTAELFGPAPIPFKKA